MVSAYTLFFVPTNYPKLFFLMNQLPVEVKEAIKRCDFIDRYSAWDLLIVFSDFIQENLTLEQKVFGVDQSALMLEQGKNWMNGFFPSLEGAIEFHKDKKRSICGIKA